MLQYLFGNKHLKKAQLWLRKFTPEQAFQHACLNGQLEVAQQLITIRPMIDISAKNEWSFRYACYYGHLEVAKWLLTVNPTIDISAENEFAFRGACCNGSLEVAKWLLTVKPTIAISDNKEDAFISACIMGHLEVAKWLQEMCPEKYQMLQETPTIWYNILSPLIKSTKILYLNVLDNCPICDDRVVQLSTLCRHQFCEPCLQKWLQNHNSCPCCRGNLANTAFQPILKK